jgi:hypothetical protein
MKTYDRGSSLFWLLISIYAFIESLRLGIGTLQNPGMGFMSFGSSGLLGILSLILFLKPSFSKAEKRIEPIFSGILWERVVFVLIALLIYAKLMPVGGYLVSTFLLMSFLFWILERGKVWWTLIFSFLTTTSTYWIFSKWLNCQFPSGIIGF